ncbi:DUF2189 domain-containing protein [Actibacterium sp. MT2.3-13A]|uniref:DUF2189 domain-containing protein n=1 Tax=Actibacterium sp. MT2.3-13A TaxID=2828332 RepID=UPI001BA4B944|nr:DUF2189 domain-containing protein [Actibacterium sp. MT2.3-13A]
MVATIGNPMSWSGRIANALGIHLWHATRRVRSAGDTAPPGVRTLEMSDLRDSLRKGVEDFAAMRSDVIAICALYPAIGALMSWVAFHANLLPHLFPLASGFALLGPVAALGLYEMSRRRESDGHAGWNDAFAVLRSPALGPILVLSAYLLALFVLWILAAYLIYARTLGPEAPASATAFVGAVLTTPEGYAMMAIGLPVGFLFALVALVISVVSFPLLLDRDVGLPVAVATSVRVARKNPGVIAVWGAIVAALLALGSIPLFLGLIVVMPVLGHATWHLYRHAVVAPGEGEAAQG